jgi:hypothetical protein
MDSYLKSKPASNRIETRADSEILTQFNSQSPINITLLEDQIPPKPNFLKRFLNRLFDKDGVCCVEEVKARVIVNNSKIHGAIFFQRF